MLTMRQQRLIADVGTGLIVASVAVALAGLTWRLAGHAGGAPMLAPVARAAPAPVDLTPAIALAPFGRPGGTATQPTALALELKGVLLTVPRQRSTALIAPAGGGAAIAYAVGDVVAGATVQEIAVDHVVLAVNGRPEILAFPRATPPATQAATGPTSAGGPVAMQPLASPALPPPDLLSTLSATPADGGYRIAGSPAAERFGLRPGDLIQNVNGVALGDPVRDRQTLAAAAAQGAARIELVRGGQRLTLTLPLR